MTSRSINSTPIFNKDPKGISKVFDFIHFERDNYHLKGQKYVATHDERQIEKAFCKSLISAVEMEKTFDYDTLIWDSIFNLNIVRYDTNEEKRVISEKEERKAITIQKLKAFAFGMANHSKTIRDELRKHKNKETKASV